MLTLKLFVGGSPDSVASQYRTWWETRPVVVHGRPQIERAGRGWKLTVFYQPPTR
jgi:hypothetical protein